MKTAFPFPFLARPARQLYHPIRLQRHHPPHRANCFSPHLLLIPERRQPLSTMAALEEKLTSLDLEHKLPKYPNCYPEYNPTDVYRAHLTEILTKLTGVEASILYPALQWTQTLEKGDLVLPVPALRIKGKKAPELTALAEEWCANVSGASGYFSFQIANL